jgi:hypothetical protein
VARLYPQALRSLFVASYDSQGYGGGIRTRLHTDFEWHGLLSSLYSPGTDRTENISSIIACSLVAGETCPQSCSLAKSVVLSPVYTAVTRQWVYMLQYVLKWNCLQQEVHLLSKGLKNKVLSELLNKSLKQYWNIQRIYNRRKLFFTAMTNWSSRRHPGLSHTCNPKM